MTDTNRALAQIFNAMADLLTGRRENPHRVRAYRRAVDSLLALEEDVAAIAKRGGLRDIPGVGKELAAKIEEYLATGQVASYETLKTPLPAEASAWTGLPGMSEPVVHYLYVRLGVRTLEDLAALVRSHLLRTLPGFTGTEEALLEAIEQRRKNQITAGGGP